MTEPGGPVPVPVPVPAESAIGPDAADRVATVLKAVADPLRLRILSLITASPTGEACVCDITPLTDVSQPTVSHHLKVLRDAGVVTSRRRGTWVHYRVTPELRAAVTTLLDGFALATAAPPGTPVARTEPVAPAPSDVESALAGVAERLGAEFPAVGAELVRSLVRESATSLARATAASGPLVGIAERFARQRLADLVRGAARDAGGPAGPPQVLFVCVANAGRSQLAAALLRHYAGSAVTVRSAGSAPGPGIHAEVAAVLAGLGQDDEPFPKPLTDDAVRAADVVVTLGCGDTCPILPGRRYEDWAVGDPALASRSGVLAIGQDLDRRVRGLLVDLLPDLPLPAPALSAPALSVS